MSYEAVAANLRNNTDSAGWHLVRLLGSFLVFLLTGLPLIVVLSVFFVMCCGCLVLSVRHDRGARVPWLSGFTGGAALGVLLQFLYTLAGGWALFGS